MGLKQNCLNRKVLLNTTPLIAMMWKILRFASAFLYLQSNIIWQVRSY